MTARQIELARHALGLGLKKSYRNRFYASPLHPDFDDWFYLAATGDARRFGDHFKLTTAGATKALLPGESLGPEDFPTMDEV